MYDASLVHFSYMLVRGRLCASVLIKNPIYHKNLLIWSQSVLVWINYRVWLLALESAAQCRFGGIVRSSSLFLTCKNIGL